MPGQFLTNRQSITSWNLPQPRISPFEIVFPAIMFPLLSSPKFFCFLLSWLLPWVHLAEEEKMISTSIADLPKVPRLFLLSHTFFDQEIEADQTEQLNSDVVSLKEEITADWSQPGLQRVLFWSWLLLLKAHYLSTKLCMHSQFVSTIRCGRVWWGDLRGDWRRWRSWISFLSPTSS